MNNNTTINNYTLKRNTRAKHIRLRVKPDLSLQISAPKYASIKTIESFVQQSTSWIEEQRHKISTLKQITPMLEWEQKKVAYLGNIYQITIDTSPSPDKIIVLQDHLTIHPLTGSAADAQKTLIQWLKNQAQHIINSKVEYWSQKMNLHPKSVRFRQQSSRWGSCTSQGTVNFNWRLVHTSQAAIDYVVVHELAHVKHHNHSTAFWEEVRTYIPQYKVAKKELSKYMLEII